MNAIESENPRIGWARPEGALKYAPFSRTTLYDLIKRNLIESHVIGKPGVKRCVRMINRSMRIFAIRKQRKYVRKTGANIHLDELATVLRHWTA
jgi:hypothetical protein